VRALVYAQLRAGDVRAIGLVDEAATWPGLTLPAGVALGDWDEARARLDASLEAVATAFAAGEARIDPRDARKLCRRCGLGPLCRIGAVGEDASAGDEGTDD
jgi:hypothetical protein